MEKKPVVALRKRQQISQANKTMFLAIAGASVVIGFSVVLFIFLFQQVQFKVKVLDEQNKTLSTIKANKEAVPKLIENVNQLNTNTDLISVQLEGASDPIQSVLDALPSSANSTAMGSSLQNKILGSVTGLRIESLIVDSADGVDASTNTIPFTFSVSASSNNKALKAALDRLEHSIRPFSVKKLTLESQGDRVLMTVSGVGYFDPEQTVELVDKVVKQ